MTTEQQPYWSGDVEHWLNRLNSSPHGLTSIEAERRYSSLIALHHTRTSPLRILLKQFTSPITLLLFASATIIFGLAFGDARASGEPFSLLDAPDGCIIVGILIAGGLLGFWQETSAADAVAKLLAVVETKCTVLRDGNEVEVPIQRVVPGDVVSVRAGSVIAGDCRLLSAHNLFVNEAALTGESFPTEKRATDLQSAESLSQRSNILHLGTHVVSGFGTALVTATGAETELGKISERLQMTAPETAFEVGIRRFGNLLIRVVLIITIVVFTIKVGWQNKPVVDSLLVGLALAVGMTPQLLPAVTSVVLANGAKAMARQNVIIKQLVAIENLGSMTVLCTDKTGTLTTGTVELHSALDVEGNASHRVLRSAFLNAHFQSGFHNPIDAAICKSTAFDSQAYQKLDELPYDFTRKRLSVLVRLGQQRTLITKGALREVLGCCSHVELPGGEVAPIDAYRPTIEHQFETISKQGMRVLGLAERAIDGNEITGETEIGLNFIGLLVFADPPKPDAQKTIDQLRALGINLKIITGDNRVVAAMVSQRVGIQSPRIATGAELRSLADAEVVEAARKTDIFAEVEPNQKEQIISALKRSGQVVGYLGDGINDAPALHAADIGISVAEAVDVAREAAQVVLLRQDLGVLVDGVREGRRTFANTLKYVFFAIAANFGYMFSLAVAGLFLPFEPLLASQILLVNLLADFPAMALATDRVDDEQIQQPRRWDTAYIARFMMTFGFASSLFDFLTFGALYYLFRDVAAAQSAQAFERLFQTGWFMESTLTGLVILAVIRTRRPLLLSRPGGLFLLAAVAISLVTLAIPFSPLGSFMGFVTPSAMLMMTVVLITILYGAGMEMVKFLFHRRSKI